jgi:hypothetical protein
MTFSFLKLPFSTTVSAWMSQIETTGGHIVDLLTAGVMSVLRVSLISGLQAPRVQRKLFSKSGYFFANALLDSGVT